MTCHHRRRWLVTSLLVAGTCIAGPRLAGARVGGAESPWQNDVVGFSEIGLRNSALITPLPAYPAPSLAKNISGVVVAAIITTTDGRMSSVTILQAPDDAIGVAMRDALLRWTFRPAEVAGRSEHYGMRGKLTFYFQISGGRGRVVNLQDMPGGVTLRPTTPPPAGAPGVRPGGAAPPTAASDHAVPADMEIGDAQMAELVRSSKPVILDIRERDEFARGHRDGAVNIPRDELVRAFVELDHARTVVIDCSKMETRLCRLGRANLFPTFARVLIFLP